MKKEHLRIGNLVSVYANTYRVLTIDNSFVRGIDEENQTYSIIPLKHLKPIELNDEWLFKLGFEKKMGSGIFLRETDINKMDYYNDTVIFDDWFTKLQRQIQHLHQLQNLYFALTGEEIIY